MEPLTGGRFEFGDFMLDGVRRTLAKGGTQLSLNARALDLLLELVRNRGSVISKDLLLERVWYGQFVEENNLTVQVSALRKILGERRNENSFIVTVPGRGYSFVAPVKEVPGPGRESLIAVIGGTDAQDPIIGRERELEIIRERFVTGSARLMSITGPGGAGKTRLVRKVETSFSPIVRDGVHFVELAELRDPARLESAVVERLGIRPETGAPVMDSVMAYFCDKQSLLILDNFEQLLPAGATFVDRLLGASPSLKILVTSRSPLRLSNELELCLQPLEVPPTDRTGAVGEVLEYPSVQLFGLRAKSARPSFEIGDADVGDIAEICRRLDGLPLSIELAAARVRILPPRNILERLNDSLGFLTFGGHNLPDRQKTIRNTVRWSYDLLNQAEQAAFRRLSVFSGGSTVEHAERLLEGTEQLPRDGDKSALDVVTALVESNLLTTRDSPDGTTRLGMLEVIREFASEQLAASGEAGIIRETHAKLFLEFGESAEPKLLSEDSAAWIELVLREIDNIRSAIDFWLGSEPKNAAQLISAVRYFWMNQGQLAEGFDWIAKGLAASDGGCVQLRFKLLSALGSISRLKGDYAAARGYFRTALEEGAEAGELRQIGLANAGIGTVCQLEGDTESARSFYERSLAITRELNDEYGVAIGLNCLADLMRNDGREEEAKSYLLEALTLYEKLGNVQAACNNLNILGQVSLDEGDEGEAHKFYREGLAIGEKLGNRINISESLHGFAALAVRRNNPDLAARLYGLADTLRESIGYTPEPGEMEFRDTYFLQAKNRMGEETFSRAYERGCLLGVGDAVSSLGNGLDALENCLDDTEREVYIETRSVTKIVIEE